MATKKEAAAPEAGRPIVNIDLSSITAPSRIYIVEHVLVHVSLLLIAISAIGLFNAVLEHFMDTQEDLFFGSTFALQELSMLIAMATVALPLFVVFYIRTRKAERAHPKLLQSRARRRLIYIALTIAALFMLGYAINAVNTVVVALVDTGVDAKVWGQQMLEYLFALKFIGMIAFFISRWTEGIDGGKK